MTDIQAAVGRAQLGRLASIVQRRRYLADRYLAALASMPDLRLAVQPDWARSNWQSFPVRLERAALQVPVMQAMLDSGIATRRGVMCAHRQPAYPPGTWTAGPLQNSEQAEDSVVLLPLFPEMTDADQDRVVATLRESLAEVLLASSSPAGVV